MPKVYWGWIPILTKKVHFEYLEQRAQCEWGSISSEEKELISKILSYSPEGYRRYYEDDKDAKENKKFKIIVCIRKHKINHVFAFDSKGEIKAHAVCLIHDDGIVEIKVIDVKLPDQPTDRQVQNIRERVAIHIYISIRDFYHSHTHHAKHDDMLLKPVQADNKKEAAEKILTQYEEKIIFYHKQIKEDIGPDKSFEDARDLITKAEGEMIYASAFTRLLKDSIDDFELYLSVFSNAISSIKILAEDIESKYISKLTQDTNELTQDTKLESKYINSLTQVLTVLTLVIVALTAPIATDATYKIVESILEHFKLTLCLPQKIGIACFYVLIFIVTIIIMVLNTRRNKKDD
ncbi:MAG: hypothetical protein KBONHNOK_00965 [Candidatus Methanoperedenaceae archaeon GB50]|nr:MAG: hypothetical protein KBONHNOK_00965 [Candidatus Methanoperedenaceae archaeon GB50]